MQATNTEYVVAYQTSYYGPRAEYEFITRAETREAAEEIAQKHAPEHPLRLGHNQSSHGPVILRVAHSGLTAPSQDWSDAPSDAEALACKLDPEGDDPDTIYKALDRLGYIVLTDEDGIVLYCREAD